MKFSDIVGQRKLKEQLQGAIYSGRVSHAYIISGERGSGKKMAAGIFAAALQCEQNDQSKGVSGHPADPCGMCHSCKMAATDNHPDIITVHHEKPNLLSVDEIRQQVVGDVMIKPYYDRRKIYIIPDAEKMNASAQNALLKTIEEPPEYTVTILLTESREMLLPTILSRCVSIAMQPLQDEEVRSYLIRMLQLQPDEASVYTAFAHGNIGRAVRIAQSEDFKRIKELTSEFLERSERAEMSEITATAKAMAEEKDMLPDILDIMLLWYHDVLMMKSSGSNTGLTFVSESGYIEKRALGCSYEQLGEINDAIRTARMRIKSNTAAEVCMDSLLLKIHENS